MAGVNLPDGQTASQVLLQVLQMTADSFAGQSQVLLDPGENLSREGLGRALIEVESARALMPNRVDVARTMLELSHQRLQFQEEGRSPVPLSDYMRGKEDPLFLKTMSLERGGAFRPIIPYEGRVYEGAEIAKLAQDFLERNTASRAAVDGLRWVAGQKTIDLTGEKFVVLGAGSEVAPTEILLRAGATVLWIDRTSPEKYIGERAIQGGVLVYPPDGADLLTQPREIAATIREFAQGDAVHIGAFAYVGGEAREWRLSASMNAVVRSLPPEIVRSLSLYVSPTGIAESQMEDSIISMGRFANPRVWEFAMRQAGILKPNLYSYEGRHWANAVVPIQGSSYLAAQYIEKRIAAEVYAVRGLGASWKREPITVSANVAGITRTRSLKTPVFEAGFVGAPSVGIETYDPEATRWLSGLLMLQDILNPEAPGQAKRTYVSDVQKGSALFSQQIHGGTYSHPYAIEGAIKLAAALGFLKKPRLLVAAVRGKKKSG